MVSAVVAGVGTPHRRGLDAIRTSLLLAFSTTLIAVPVALAAAYAASIAAKTLGGDAARGVCWRP